MTKHSLARLAQISEEEYIADESGRFWTERAAARYCRALLDECDAITDKEAFMSTELYRLAVGGAERLAIEQPWRARRRAG